MTDNKLAVHEMTVTVPWGDMDALGHVNNARYFDYFQEARIEWMASLGLDLKQTTGPVVVHIACTFLKPVVYPAQLILRSSLHSLGRSSMMMDHVIYQGDERMAEGQCKIVWIDYQLVKPIPFPDSIRALFVENIIN
jgi:acyl-CoA thioester hydrolase